MIFLILIAAWCLLRGRIKLAPRLVLEGKRARALGGLLLMVSYLSTLPWVQQYLLGLMPKGIIDGMTASQPGAYGVYTLINLAFLIVVLYGLALLCRFVGPNLSKELSKPSA